MEMNTTPSSNLNTTGIFNENDPHAKLTQSLNIMSLIIYCVAFLLGVLGNGVVIWVTGFRMKKTVNTVWFLNLAVADFLFTASLPLAITYLALDFHWPFGRFMCKLNSTISSVNMFASVYILVVISVDRCVAVVWPVWAQNHRSVRKASCVSLGVWVLALTLSAPDLIFRDTEPSMTNQEVINCFNNYALTDAYNETFQELEVFRFQAMTISRFLLGFVVPFTVIVSCYAVIMHRLRRNRTLARKSKRSVKIIAVVIITFFLCWAPFHIFNLMDMVEYVTGQSVTPFTHIIEIGTPITTSLAFINSCLNPLLYVFMGQGFRDRVSKSIIRVLESAFKEDVSRAYSLTNTTNTTNTSQNTERSVLNTVV